MRRPGAGPTTTKSGLVHVHALLAPAEYERLKAEAEGKTISFVLRRLVARHFRLPPPEGAVYQRRRPTSAA
jgi:hypothetical protein